MVQPIVTKPIELPSYQTPTTQNYQAPLFQSNQNPDIPCFQNLEKQPYQTFEPPCYQTSESQIYQTPDLPIYNTQSLSLQQNSEENISCQTNCTSNNYMFEPIASTAPVPCSYAFAPVVTKASSNTTGSDEKRIEDIKNEIATKAAKISTKNEQQYEEKMVVECSEKISKESYSGFESCSSVENNIALNESIIKENFKSSNVQSLQKEEVSIFSESKEQTVEKMEIQSITQNEEHYQSVQEQISEIKQDVSSYSESYEQKMEIDYQEKQEIQIDAKEITESKSNDILLQQSEVPMEKADEVAEVCQHQTLLPQEQEYIKQDVSVADTCQTINEIRVNGEKSETQLLKNEQLENQESSHIIKELANNEYKITNVNQLQEQIGDVQENGIINQTETLQETKSDMTQAFKNLETILEANKNIELQTQETLTQNYHEQQKQVFLSKSEEHYEQKNMFEQYNQELSNINESIEMKTAKRNIEEHVYNQQHAVKEFQGYDYHEQAESTQQLSYEQLKSCAFQETECRKSLQQKEEYEKIPVKQLIKTYESGNFLQSQASTITQNETDQRITTEHQQSFTPLQYTDTNAKYVQPFTTTNLAPSTQFLPNDQLSVSHSYTNPPMYYVADTCVETRQFYNEAEDQATSSSYEQSLSELNMSQYQQQSLYSQSEFQQKYQTQQYETQQYQSQSQNSQSISQTQAIISQFEQQSQQIAASQQSISGKSIL
jgi:hypothetical protein